MQIKLQIRSENDTLQSILRQFFSDINIITDCLSSDADIVIDQLTEGKVIILNSRDKEVFEIPKPLSISKLINNIEQIISKFSEEIINIGPITFIPSKKLCKINNEEIFLTSKESEVLLFLSKHPNQVFDKNTLLHSIWGYSDDITTHTLETHIYKLRAKFSKQYDLISSSNAGYSLEYNK